MLLRAWLEHSLKDLHVCVLRWWLRVIAACTAPALARLAAGGFVVLNAAHIHGALKLHGLHKAVAYPVGVVPIRLQPSPRGRLLQFGALLHTQCPCLVRALCAPVQSPLRCSCAEQSQRVTHAWDQLLVGLSCGCPSKS